MGMIPERFISLVVLAIYLVNCIFNLVGGIKSCKMQRARLMSTGYTGMGICHLGVFACMLVGSKYLPMTSMSAPVGFIALMLEMGAVAVFAVCLSTPAMLYTTEIIQPIARNLLIPLAVSVGWLLHFMLTLIVPALFKVMGPFVFLSFAVVCLGLLLASTHYIETKDRTEDQLASAAAAERDNVGFSTLLYKYWTGAGGGWYSNQGTLINTESEEQMEVIDGVPVLPERGPTEYTVRLSELPDDHATTLLGMPRTARTRRLLSRGITVREGQIWTPSLYGGDSSRLRGIDVLADLEEEPETSLMEQVVAHVFSPPPAYTESRSSSLASDHTHVHASGVEAGTTEPQPRVLSDASGLSSSGMSSGCTSYKTSQEIA